MNISENQFLLNIFKFNLFDQIPEIFSHLAAVFSSICSGFVIGWNRERAGKAAGLRTFALVCLGSTLYCLIAKEISGSDALARVVAQIVSGIGFIGAGAVFQTRNHVTGLTTAAGIWVAAALGIIFGLGYLPFGFVMTLSVLALFQIQSVLENHLFGPCQHGQTIICFSDSTGKNRVYLEHLIGEGSRISFQMKMESDLTSGRSGEYRIVVRHCQYHRAHKEFLAEVSRLDFVTQIKTSTSDS